MAAPGRPAPPAGGAAGAAPPGRRLRDARRLRADGSGQGPMARGPPPPPPAPHAREREATRRVFLFAGVTESRCPHSPADAPSCATTGAGGSHVTCDRRHAGRRAQARRGRRRGAALHGFGHRGRTAGRLAHRWAELAPTSASSASSSSRPVSSARLTVGDRRSRRCRSASGSWGSCRPEPAG